MEKRKLIYSEDAKLRERKRVRNFTIGTIIIGLILCVLVIPLLEIKSYENDKKISQKYMRVAKDIWYNGINGIEYNELRINILDTAVEYESIYNQEICSIFDKVQVMIYMQDIGIIQDMNTMTIQKNSRKILTLKFSNENEEVIKTNKVIYVFIEIFSILFCIIIGYVGITSYETAGNKRMIIDMNKHS